MADLEISVLPTISVYFDPDERPRYFSWYDYNQIPSCIQMDPAVKTLNPLANFQVSFILTDGVLFQENVLGSIDGASVPSGWEAVVSDGGSRCLLSWKGEELTTTHAVRLNCVDGEKSPYLVFAAVPPQPEAHFRNDDRAVPPSEPPDITFSLDPDLGYNLQRVQMPDGFHFQPVFRVRHMTDLRAELDLVGDWQFSSPSPDQGTDQVPVTLYEPTQNLPGLLPVRILDPSTRKKAFFVWRSHEVLQSPPAQSFDLARTPSNSVPEEGGRSEPSKPHRFDPTVVEDPDLPPNPPGG